MPTGKNAGSGGPAIDTTNNLPTNLCFLFTTRPNSDILVAPLHSPQIIHKEMGDIPQDVVDADIQKFIYPTRILLSVTCLEMTCRSCWRPASSSLSSRASMTTTSGPIRWRYWLGSMMSFSGCSKGDVDMRSDRLASTTLQGVECTGDHDQRIARDSPENIFWVATRVSHQSWRSNMTTLVTFACHIVEQWREPPRICPIQQRR